MFRILIVEDDLTTAKLIKKIVARSGFEHIESVSSGEEALEHIMASKKTYHFILSDLNMPKMSGIDFLKKIRNMPSYKDVIFILITAESSVQQVREAINLKVSDYIVKPLNANLIQEKLTFHIQQLHSQKAVVVH